MDCAADDPSPLSTACLCITRRRTGKPLTAPPRAAADTTGACPTPGRGLADGKRGRSAAVRRAGGWSCACTDPVADTDAPPLIAGAKPPAALKRGLIVPLPPFDYQEVA
jgi:hypothetical protein